MAGVDDSLILNSIQEVSEEIIGWNVINVEDQCTYRFHERNAALEGLFRVAGRGPGRPVFLGTLAVLAGLGCAFCSSNITKGPSEFFPGALPNFGLIVTAM